MFRVLSVISIFLPLLVSENVIDSENGLNYNVSIADVDSKIFPSSTDISFHVASARQNKVYFRVIDGTPAEPTRFHYMVSLKRTFAEFGYHQFLNMCGGALIATSKILSAGHCFERDGNICQRICKMPRFYSPGKYFAVAGSRFNLVKMEKGGQWRRLKKIVVPRHYWFPSNDVAIAFTRQPFVFNDNVKALPYATKFMDYGSKTCVVSGYGRTGRGRGSSYSQILLWAKLKLIPAAKCSKIHKRYMHDFICTSQFQADVMQGDSGGPLVCNKTGDPNDEGAGVIVGIVSGTFDGKSFFTRVSSYNKFIAKGHGCETSCPASYIVWLSLILLYPEIS